MTAGPPVHESPHDTRPDPPVEAPRPTPRPVERAALPLEDLKQAQRSMWALGDYPQVARDLLGPLAQRLVAACGIREGQHVLDVAAGSGNLALQAASAGAHVIAADLTPALFPAGRTEAVERRVALEWVEADAEDLPFHAGMFDTVVSCVGAMFAPRHRQTATEMVRVCRLGGTIGLASWTPAGSVGSFLAVFAPYLPPPVLGALSPVLWGDPDHVQTIFGDRVDWREHTREVLRIDHFATPEEFCAYFKARFGPTMRAYAHVADDPVQTAALDRDFLRFAREHAHRDARGGTYYDFEYLLSVGTVRTG
jgi:SAM-dependent methyltransferase